MTVQELEADGQQPFHQLMKIVWLPVRPQHQQSSVDECRTFAQPRTHLQAFITREGDAIQALTISPPNISHLHRQRYPSAFAVASVAENDRGTACLAAAPCFIQTCWRSGDQNAGFPRARSRHPLYAVVPATILSAPSLSSH